MIRVVVVDDHALFRAGLVELLEDMGGIQVIGEAANGLDAIELVKNAHPDIVLMDVNMPLVNGVEVMQALRRLTKCKFIMLAAQKNDDDINQAMTSGADGYLLKNLEPEEIRKAVRQILEGKAVSSPENFLPGIKAISEMSSPSVGKRISRREIDILDCLAKGMTTGQISASLYISENTVKTHIRHILGKLGASNRSEAVARANKIGLIR